MFCFAGFGMDRLRCEQAMKTTGRRNPNHWAAKLSNRANGAERHNRSCSTTWAVKVEKFQPREKFFFLTFPFIEQLGPFARTTGPKLDCTLEMRQLRIRFRLSAGQLSLDRCTRMLYVLGRRLLHSALASRN